MSQRVQSPIIIALAIVLAALLLRGAPTVQADQSNPRPFSFMLSLSGDETKLLGTVPPGKVVFLKDFYAMNSDSTTYEVVVDGTPVSPELFVAGRGTSNNGSLLLSFSNGFEVRGGETMAIHRIDTSTPDVTQLFVAGVLCNE